MLSFGHSQCATLILDTTRLAVSHLVDRYSLSIYGIRIKRSYSSRCAKKVHFTIAVESGVRVMFDPYMRGVRRVSSAMKPDKIFVSGGTVAYSSKPD